MPASVQEHLLTASAATPSAKRNSAAEPNESEAEAKVCWIEIKRYPYQPDHQVELLHLQAEADALLIMLQAAEQKASGASREAGNRK